MKVISIRFTMLASSKFFQSIEQCPDSVTFHSYSHTHTHTHTDAGTGTGTHTGDLRLDTGDWLSCTS